MKKYQIAKIIVDEAGTKCLYDCKDRIIETTNKMNRRYREERKQFISETDNSVIWVLIGIENSGKEKYLQVGNNKNLTRMLSGDVGPDISEIINIKGNFNGTKYNKLTEVYHTLVFYEVDIASYNFEDSFMINEIPHNYDLKKAYWAIKASYIEGKIASEYNCRAKKNNGKSNEMWNPSPIGLDGYFYSYFENK